MLKLSRLKAKSNTLETNSSFNHSNIQSPSCSATGDLIELQCKQFSFSTDRVNAKTFKPNQSLSFSDVAALVQNGINKHSSFLYQNIAEAATLWYESGDVRAKENMNTFKMNLNWLILSGTCYSGHTGKDLTPNGYIQVDIDFHKKGGHIKAESIKRQIAIKQPSFIAMCAISPTLYGLKILIKTSIPKDKITLESYKYASGKAIDYLIENFDVTESESDRASLKIAQVCYLPFDPSVYVNFEHTDFDVDLSEYERKTAVKQTQSDRKTAVKHDSDEVKQAIEFLYENKVIIGNTYAEFLSFTAACINVFGYDLGKDIASDILHFIPNIETSNFWKGFEKTVISVSTKGEGRETIATDGTITYIAKQNGFRYVQPIAPTADTIIEALEVEKLSDVLKRMNITSVDLANKKLIAPTGLGKGFLVNSIADTTGESVILVCPNTLLVFQFAERYGFTPFCANTDKKSVRGVKKIAVTYHSFARLTKLINVPDFHVFLDESQNFTSGASQNYLLQPLHSVINCLQFCKFKAVTLLTGTDIFNFHPYFTAFKNLKVKAVRKAIDYTITDCTDLLATAAAKALHFIKKKRFPVIFLNSKGINLEKLIVLLGQTKVAIINANEKGSTDFENIVTNGLVSDDVQCLICTSSLKEGNDILNNFSFDFIVADAKIGSIELRQLVGRARNAQDVSLHILKSENRVKSDYAYNISKRCAKLEAQANDECLELNEGHYDYTTNQLAEKIRKGIQNIAVRVNEKNVFEVDYLLLSNMVYTEMVSCEYANNSYQQTNLERLGFKLLGNETDAAETDTNIKEELEAKKQAEKEKFETEYAQYIEILKTTEDVREHIKINKPSSKAEKTVVERIERLQTEFFISPAECVEIIAIAEKKTDFKLVVDRMRVSNYLTNVKNDTKLSIFYKSLKSAFEVGVYYTPDEIREKVLMSVELLKTVDMAKFDKDKERNTNILKELRKVYGVRSIVKKVDGKCKKIYCIEKVTLDCLNKVNKTKVAFQEEVFEDAPF